MHCGLGEVTVEAHTLLAVDVDVSESDTEGPAQYLGSKGDVWVAGKKIKKSALSAVRNWKGTKFAIYDASKKVCTAELKEFYLATIVQPDPETGWGADNAKEKRRTASDIWTYLREQYAGAEGVDAVVSSSRTVLAGTYQRM